MLDLKEKNLTKNSVKSQKSTNPCKTGFSTTQILVHNIPLFSMYVIGTFIIGIYCLYCSIGFIFYIIFSNIVFMITICAYCPHYGSNTSLCGYGLITKYFTTRKRPKEFKAQFKKFIIVLFPVWFVPLIVGLILIYNSFTLLNSVLLIIYIIVAFGIVLIVSRSESCKTCKHREQCPWNKICGN